MGPSRPVVCLAGDGVGALLALRRAWAADRRALAGGRAAATLLFGVRPNDPAILLLALAALVGIALVASYLPARRATRIEPVSALRAD